MQFAQMFKNANHPGGTSPPSALLYLLSLRLVSVSRSSCPIMSNYRRLALQLGSLFKALAMS
jgi:hypothetical protein